MQTKHKTTWSKALLLTALVGLVGQHAYGMDLLQVYQAALQQDATLQAARSATRAEQERLPQARAQLLPNISLSLTENSNKLESTTPDFLGREQTTLRDYTSSNQTLSLRQPLIRPQIWAQYRQAKAQAVDAQSVYHNEEQNLAVRVCGAYFEAMLAHDQMALIMAQQAVVKSQRDAAQKAYQAGLGTRTDIDETQARLDLNLAQEIEARQNVSYTLQQVQSLISDPITQLPKFNANKLESLELAPQGLEEWIAQAEQNNPQLQALQARIIAAEEEINKTQSGHWPTLDLVAQLQKSASENVTNTSSRYNNSTVGLQLNVPLYAGGYYNSAVRQAQANLERAQHNYDAAKRNLSLQVHKEYRGVTENLAKVKALELALRSAEQLVTSSQKSFQGGSRSILDILNAEQQRVSVQRDLMQARYIYLISQIRLLALTGKADQAAIQQINNIFEAAW
jgi:outer membrane protein/protease secretion system outer membrane protein